MRSPTTCSAWFSRGWCPRRSATRSGSCAAAGYGSRAPIGGACAHAPARPCYAASPRASPGSSSWTSPSRRPARSTRASSMTTLTSSPGASAICASSLCRIAKKNMPAIVKRNATFNQWRSWRFSMPSATPRRAGLPPVPYAVALPCVVHTVLRRRPALRRRLHHVAPPSAGRRHLPRVRSPGQGVTDVGMAKIGDRVPSLQSLDVSHCRKLSDKGLKAIALGCQNLRQMVIVGCRLITDSLLIALSKSCIQLEDLGAAGCNNITDAGISGLADGCHKMKSLDISKCNKVGDPGVCKFAEVSSSSLVSLKLLDCNKVGDKSIHTLAKFCHNLETLVIGGCRDVTDESIQAVAFACRSSLKNLRMDWCLKLTDSSLRSLLSNCKLLVAIDVGCCDQITDAAFHYMDANGFQSALRLLKISSCVRITVAGVRNVIESCKALEHLDVRSCPQVTRQSCEQAGLQFPGSCKVNFEGSLSESDPSVDIFF